MFCIDVLNHNMSISCLYKNCMAGRLLSIASRGGIIRLKPFGSAGSHHDTARTAIGNREIVGYGWNGEPGYVDKWDYPFPSVRWMETTPDIVALRGKERGDWRKLSLAEKKVLYRTSFRQTFAEFTNPTGEWKSILGWGIFYCTLGVVLFILESTLVFHGPLQEMPKSFSEESQRAQLRRILDIKNNPVLGISSQWDYKNDFWKR